MSLNDLEAVKVKVEPNDEAKMESDDLTHLANNNLHLTVKEEPDWNIEAYSASKCRDQLVKKDQMTTSVQVDNVNSEIKNETERLSKAPRESWYVDHVVKVERDIDESDVSEASQVNECSDYTQAACKNLDVKKDTNSIITIDTSNGMIATPTGLYVDHVVKVERESDEFTKNVPCILGSNQNHLLKQSGLTEREAIKSSLRTDNMVKIECAAPLTRLYLDHVVKEELVVGPEVMQRSHQVTKEAGGNTGYGSCSVRLETMQVDKEHGICRIGRNTYKLGPCLEPQQGSITQNEQHQQIGTKTKSLSHQNSNEREKPHICDVCDFATAYRYKLTHHKRKHSGDKPFRCNLCSYASANKAHLQIHEKTHSKIKPYKCDKCSYACVQKSDLQVHERKHTGEKPYKCDYCIYACTRKRDLLTHIRTHTGEKPYRCQHCDYGCIRKRDLIAHTNTYHSENNDSQEYTKMYKCNYCNFSTPLKQGWIAHERKIHSSEKPYQCKRCNYAVSCRTSFLNHIQKHSGKKVEKRHKCSQCDYATNHKTHLYVHQKTHTGEKPYKCSQCAYASAHRRDLFVHEVLHKGDKLYKCNKCSYGCNNLSHLRIHEKMHAGGNEKKLSEKIKEIL